jgi:hypothetical protein
MKQKRKYLRVEWMLAVPVDADEETLRLQAALITPNATTGFHGYNEIISRIWIEREEDGDGEEE